MNTEAEGKLAIASWQLVALKTVIVLLFTFNIQPLPSSAQLVSDFPYLTISTLNDNWGGAFTPIKDDQRSFGFIVDYQFELLNCTSQAKITYSGLTNRFANPDSSRLDELEIFLRFPVWRLEDKLIISAIGGAIITGDLGGEQLQNSFHEAVGVAPVILPYPIGNKTFAFIGASLWGKKTLTNWGYESYFNLESNIEYQLAPGYTQKLKIQIGPTVSNARNDKIWLYLGYANTQAYFNNAALKSVANTETGFFLNYGMKLGIANFGFTVYPESKFTMGYIGLTLLNGGVDKKLEHVDVTSEIGALGDDKGLFVRYLWNKAGADKSNWLFDAHYQFWTLGKKHTPDYPNVLSNYQQFSLGANYHFIKPKNTLQAIPYVSARAGVKQIRTYAGQQPASTQSDYHFMMLGEAGLRIKFPTNIVNNNCFYGLTPSYQVAQAFGQQNETSVYFGLAGFVMIDF
jgi:hypothetical protein